ncbi:septation protein imp2 [Favolaschia claudopus]|uniref:Septation protein imp2 n=1 Tax=Favolaschia claudopus TaxID=2862362 RepID=A0AAW0E1Y2_9AGAR
MSARRQASTTSLSKYARGAEIGPHDRSTDFCNAFWGLADGGVDVLFARMRGAARTMDELRNFWKERASIEEDYARRLTKLAKQTLGRDEIGELRNCLDTIRTETEKQGQFHLTLAQQVRGDLETQASSFYAKQQHHRKVYQASIEKEFKSKQTQEAYVTKAREKYENDCMRINSYTAQLGLVQGKDAERIHLKLDRAQQTVVTNERDFANFARALSETVAKWENDWRIFCDSCQDLEDDRIEFTKDNLWAYANAVSSVCVSDDESCEHMRLALEQMEPEKDMENFVRDYGTGSQVPDPPAFVNFSDPNAVPTSSSKQTYRVANFPRSSQRPPPAPRNSAPPEEEEPQTNGAGVGLPVRRGDDSSAAPPPPQSVVHSNPVPIPAQRQSSDQPPPQFANGYTQSPSSNGPSPDVSRQVTRKSVSPSYRVPPRDPLAEPLDPTADTFIKVGPNAYKVDLSKDPAQPGPSASSRMSMSSSPQNASAVDPLAKQMEELQTQGTVRRNSRSSRRPAIEGTSQNSHTRPSSSMSLATPAQGGSGMSQHSQRAQSPASGRDYRQSADAVVGSYPTTSRPVSPAPITAAFMRPPSTGPPPGTEHIADVLNDYQQSLPGERKSMSRSNSRRGSYTGPPPGAGHSYNASNGSQQSQGQTLTRPPSQQGYAGIGSRSPSPQPMSRGPSPAPMAAAPANMRQSFIAPPSASSSMNSRQGAVSPNNLGIALDSSGRVIHDEMAHRYSQQQQQQQQPQHQQRQSMPPQQTGPQGGYATQPQRRISYMGGPTSSTPAPQQPPYGAMTPYQPQQPAYVPPPPPLQPAYTSSSYQQQPPPAQQQQQQQHVYQPQPHASAYQAVNHLQRGMSNGNGGSGYYPDARQQQQQQQQQPPLQQQQQLVRVPQQQQQQLVRVPQQHQMQLQPAHRSPSPQPQQRQQTSDGKWILFYVKALFDYNATIDEEFNFQEGDIIAVTATPEDGWWSGELLDDSRRVPGKHIFPSNFVVLFT